MNNRIPEATLKTDPSSDGKPDRAMRYGTCRMRKTRHHGGIAFRGEHEEHRILRRSERRVDGVQ